MDEQGGSALEGGEAGGQGESQQQGSESIAAGAPPPDLSAAAQEQHAAEQEEKQAAEVQAHATKHALDAARNSGRQRAPYWQTLVPVIVTVGGRQQCKLQCTKGGPGCCGKLLSSKNVPKSAKDQDL